MQAFVDRGANRVGVARDADRETRQGGVVRGVVQRECPLVCDPEYDRGFLAVDVQHAESEPPPSGEGLGNVTEEAVGVAGEELGLLAARSTVERHEPIEHRPVFGFVSKPESDTAPSLEATELAPKLVTLRFAEAPRVRLEAVRKSQSGCRDQAADADVVPGRAQHCRHRIQAPRLLRNELQVDSRRALPNDPFRERLRHGGHVRGFRDDVLVVGELTPRERDRAVIRPSERGDSAAARDRESDLLAAVMRARGADPFGREEDRRVRTTPGQLGPFGLERCRIARGTDRVGRGEDPPSLGERTCRPNAHESVAAVLIEKTAVDAQSMGPARRNSRLFRRWDVILAICTNSLIEAPPTRVFSVEHRMARS